MDIYIASQENSWVFQNFYKTEECQIAYRINVSDMVKCLS